MKQLSIEHLKQMRAAYYEAQHENKVIALDELIAFRELKDDQVPVYQMYYDGFWRDVDKEHYEHFKIKGSEVRVLFTAPQKPVVIAPNRKDMFWTAANAGFVAQCDNEWKAAIEAAGVLLKEKNDVN